MSNSRQSYSRETTSRRRSRSPERGGRYRNEYSDQKSSSNSSSNSSSHNKRYESSSLPSSRRLDDNDRQYDNRDKLNDDYHYNHLDDRQRSSYNRYTDDKYRHTEIRKSRHYDDKRLNERHFEDRWEQLEPNINVVLRNLPDNAREVDIQNKLIEMEASVDDVSLIRDRDSGESRKFAFIRFTSVGHAVQFVEKHRNFNWNSYRVRVDYCKKDIQSNSKDEWCCVKCGTLNIFARRNNCCECGNPHTSTPKEERPNDDNNTILSINDGTKDISNDPSNMLLLRQLDHLTSEESTFNAVKSLQGVHRALLIRDKMTKMSCEFAFIEFYNTSHASMALEYARELLQIDGHKVSVSFANRESFIPVYGQSEWSIPALEEADGLISYWDKSSYAAQYSPAIVAERLKKEEETRKSKEEQEAKKIKVNSLEDDLNDFYADMGDFGAESNDDIFAVPKPSSGK